MDMEPCVYSSRRGHLALSKMENAKRQMRYGKCFANLARAETGAATECRPTCGRSTARPTVGLSVHGGQ